MLNRLKYFISDATTTNRTRRYVGLPTVAIVRSFKPAVLNAIAKILEEVREEIHDSTSEDFQTVPAHLLFDNHIDQDGGIIPPPNTIGKLPKYRLANETPAAIIMYANRLLHLRNPEENSVVDLVRRYKKKPKLDVEKDMLFGKERKPFRKWSYRASAVLNSFLKHRGMIASNAKEMKASEFADYLNLIVGTGRVDTGVYRHLQLLVLQEVDRMFEADRAIAEEWLVPTGFTGFKIIAEEGSERHRHLDGTVVTETSPNAFLPPFGINCNCTRSRLVDLGFERREEVYWEAFPFFRSGGRSMIVPREVTRWATWVGEQLDEVKAEIVGHRRWMTLQSRVNASTGIGYWDFVGTNGKYLTVKELADTSRDLAKHRDGVEKAARAENFSPAVKIPRVKPTADYENTTSERLRKFLGAKALLPVEQPV